MKKNLLMNGFLTGCCILAIGSGNLAFAETKTADQNKNNTEEVSVTVISIPTLLERLNASGYSGIHKVKLDGDSYKVEGWDMQGRKFKLDVDAKSGKVPEVGTKGKFLTLLEVAKKLDEAGYKNITSMEFEKGNCEVKAHDNTGHRVKVLVDLKTGVISKG